MSNNIKWYGTSKIESKQFNCWNCDNSVASDCGYFTDAGDRERIYICPHCSVPNYINKFQEQIPAPSVGSHIESLPKQVSNTYDEARKAFSAGAFTASALMCRKLLMNIAVIEGATENNSFKHYVNWLYDNHHISPKSKDWVDSIRDKGNEATHEIPAITQEEATQLIVFSEMILKTLYEFPAKTVKTNGQ